MRDRKSLIFIKLLAVIRSTLWIEIFSTTSVTGLNLRRTTDPLMRSRLWQNRSSLNLSSYARVPCMLKIKEKFFITSLHIFWRRVTYHLKLLRKQATTTVSWSIVSPKGKFPTMLELGGSRSNSPFAFRCRKNMSKTSRDKILEKKTMNKI